ncbi:MAG: hypothetical protein ACREBS_04785 [Nitrososphaerales archaeon]
MALLVCDADFLIKITNDPLPAFHSLSRKESDFVLATIPLVVRELKGLVFSKTPKTARRARNALRSVGQVVNLIGECAEQDANTEADEALIEFAHRAFQEEIFVATLDGKLLSKLERTKVPYLTLRNDKPFVRSFSRRATYLTAKNE